MPECFLEAEEEIKVFSDGYDLKQAEAIERYLREHEGLDAVVCAEYGVAKYLGMFKEEVNRRGLKVCCMDENYLSSGTERFTHIKQDERKAAACAFRLLIQQMEGGREAGAGGKETKMDADSENGAMGLNGQLKKRILSYKEI